MTRSHLALPSLTRRGFLGTAAATTAVSSTAAARRPGGQEMLRVGLVGCGGRGTGAAVNALRADENVQLTAMGDLFGDHIDSRLEALLAIEDIAPKIAVTEDTKFTGWDAYQKVIDSCDVVLLATSPHFRPLHLAAAVEAGKHLFVEKPIATDATGVRAVLASCEKAKEKGLSVVSGLCYRYQHAKRATIERIHDGAVGDVAAMQCTYNASGLWLRTPPEGTTWTAMETQMRNWLYYTWLSGDHIAEQHIHSLDKLAWAMDGYPVKCVSSGGRIVRTGEEYGNVYDHFNTVFEWEGGVRGFSSCRQWNNAKTEVSDWIFGTRGRANIQRHRIESGPWDWRYDSEEPDDMYQNEHDELFAAIRSGEPINNGEYMCNSTMMAIMGRLAAYTGKEVSWEEAWNSQEDFTLPRYDWDVVPEAPIARPGVTEFV